MQEKGEIFFFYRPRVEKEEAHSPDDVQLYLELRPGSGERAVEEKQSPQSGKEGSKKGSSSIDHDGGGSSASAGKNGREGEHGCR